MVNHNTQYMLDDVDAISLKMLTIVNDVVVSSTERPLLI